LLKKLQVNLHEASTSASLISEQVRVC